MNKKVSYNWIDKDFGRLENRFSSKNLQSFETTWECGSELGKGSIKRIIIRNGFEIWFSQCYFKPEVVFDHNDAPAKLLFTFVLSGSYKTRFNSGKGPNKDSVKGQAGIWFNPSGASYDIRIESLNYLAIMIDPSLFHGDFKESIDLFPEPLRERLNGNIEEQFIHFCKITPGMQLALDQIINCQYRGIVRKMFMEARALELMALQIQSIKPELMSLNKSPVPLHPMDMKGAEQVQKILVQKMDSPHDLKDLARSAGMSSSKLNRCFKKQYGMTVFQYLRHTRMETARDLIIRKGISVTEAAYLVGYCSLSHFSQAYKKQYGLSPRENLSDLVLPQGSI